MRVLLLLATGISGFCASGVPPAPLPVTVLLDFDQPHSEGSVKVMRDEARCLLADAGISLDVKLRSEVPGNAEFTDVVVFKMKGRCAMDPVPVLIDERGPLALAWESDGQVLSFGEIRCDRVRASLKRRMHGADYTRGDLLLGRALGRVLAHEMYHILGNVPSHTAAGITRSSLSATDLTELGPSFDAKAKERIEEATRATAADANGH